MFLSSLHGPTSTEPLSMETILAAAGLKTAISRAPAPDPWSKLHVQHRISISEVDNLFPNSCSLIAPKKKRWSKIQTPIRNLGLFAYGLQKKELL